MMSNWSLSGEPRRSTHSSYLLKMFRLYVIGLEFQIPHKSVNRKAYAPFINNVDFNLCEWHQAQLPKKDRP